jgi:hypothetical protein
MLLQHLTNFIGRDATSARFCFHCIITAIGTTGLPPCSLGLSATSQQYFSLRTNQPPANSQQYFFLRTNQHQPSATSQTNRLCIEKKAHGATIKTELGSWELEASEDVLEWREHSWKRKTWLQWGSKLQTTANLDSGAERSSTRWAGGE